MSRSYRHSPFIGMTTAESEKDDKRRARRNLRHREKHTEEPVNKHEVSCVWTFAEKRIDRVDILKTMAKLVGSDENKSLTKDQSIVLSFLMIKTQGGAKPIASEDDIPQDLRVIIFPDGKNEFRADGVRMP